MAQLTKLNDDEMENISGGVLKWTQDGVVTVMNGDPNLQYAYTDYYECQAWLIANWHTVQTEECLQAMEAAGLVHRI